MVARIEEIIKKSQWIKDSGKELDLDLYGELTWLYRLLQDKNRDGQKGNIWEHLQHQQSFHFPTAHCIAMMRHPKWYISILFNNVGLNKKFLLGFNLEEEEISYPEYLPNPQQELDDEFHFVLCSRWAHNVHFYFVMIQFSFFLSWRSWTKTLTLFFLRSALMKVLSFLPRNFVGIWKRWELGLGVERGCKIHYITSIFIFFNFQVRYLRQNSRKADKVPKSCLIALNLSFNTYLSIKSLKNADLISIYGESHNYMPHPKKCRVCV